MKRGEPKWICLTCRAKNPYDVTRCRICMSIALPGTIPPRPEARPTPEPVPVGAAAPPAAPSWQPQPAPTRQLQPQFQPQPQQQLPPGYPPPPPGWYPPPPPPRRRSAGKVVGTIAAVIAACLVALAAGGFVIGRQDDPDAAKDRSALESAALTIDDVGAGFTQVFDKGYTRSRAGLRVEGDICPAEATILEGHGQAGVTTAFQRIEPGGLQVVGADVFALDSVAQAKRLVATVTDDYQSCIEATFRAGADAATDASVSVTIGPAADGVAVADESELFKGSMSIVVPQGRLDLPISAVVVRQGRAVMIAVTADSFGNVSEQLPDLLNAVLGRLLLPGDE